MLALVRFSFWLCMDWLVQDRCIAHSFRALAQSARIHGTRPAQMSCAGANLKWWIDSPYHESGCARSWHAVATQFYRAICTGAKDSSIGSNPIRHLHTAILVDGFVTANFGDVT